MTAAHFAVPLFVLVVALTAFVVVLAAMMGKR